MAVCMKCGRELSYNEIGAYRKFINRGADRFLCRECLAAHLKVEPEVIDQKIELFKQQGCTLFV